MTISLFKCTASSTWLINCTDSSTWLDHQLKKDVGCKVLQLITWWRSWSYLVTKPYSVQTQQLLQKLGQIRFLVTLFFTQWNCALVQLVSPFTALEIILIYVQGCEKRKPKHTFMDWMKIWTENLNFINLDRYPIYWATVEPRVERDLFKPW